MAKVDNIANKPLVFHGIGQGVFETVSGKVLEITEAQSMTINVTASTEDVYGGDGLFPLLTYLTNKEGSIEITNATFKLSQLAISQDVEYKATSKRLYRALITKDSNKLSDASLTGVEVTNMIAPSGQKVVLGDAAADDVVYISPTGTVEVGTSVSMEDGEYSVWYKADDTSSITASMLKNAMPEVSSFRWKFIPEALDGNKYQIDIYAKRTRANGEFSIDTSRDSASTPTLTVNILDPGDGNDDFMEITISKIA